MSGDDDFEAELFSPVTSGIFNANWLHEPATGIWRAPVPREFQREAMRQMYLSQTGTADPAPFDAVFPMLWRLPSEPKSPGRVTMVMLDTGCLTEHPLLEGCIEDTCDFTGETVEDRIGHGTGVALTARMMPFGGWRPQLFIGKVFAEDRRDAARNLIRGIEWAAGLARSLDRRINIILRVGVYNRRWLGLRSCDGTCDVCQAALRALQDPRVSIDAAPGNRAGQTACPASAALRVKDTLKPDPAMPDKPRFVSMAPRNYADAGVGTMTIEGDGHYSFSTDTVTLFPPKLLTSLLPLPALAAAMNAGRQSLGESFFAYRGSWTVAKIGGRPERVPLWPGGGEGTLSFEYNRTAQGVTLTAVDLPGFAVSAPTTDMLHVKLPQAVQDFLAAHPELPGPIRDRATEMARKLTIR